MKTSKGTLIGSLVVLSVLGTGAAAEPFVYVTRYADDAVAVIDAATSSIVATIPVSDDPSGIALSPNGTRAYVANHGIGVVSVINTATNVVIAEIPGVFAASSIVVAPDGTRAWVGTDFGFHDVYALDLVTNSIAASIHFIQDVNLGMDLLPDGSRLYVAPAVYDHLVSIDTGTNMPVGDALGFQPSGLANDLIVTPDGTRAYVSRQAEGSGRITIVDLATSSQAGEISVGSEPWGLAFGADGTLLYVAGSGTGTISVIDTVTNQVVGEPIVIGGSPRYLAVTPDGTRLFVTNDGNDTVSIVDLATNSVVDTLDVAGMPHGIAIGPGPAVVAMAIDPANPLTLYAGTAGAGVYRTVDGGESWAPANTGITDFDIIALVVATDGSAVYAGTRAGGVFKSTDNGTSWNAVNNGLDPHILSLEIVPGNGTTLYASVDDGGGVYRTTDGGTTWTAVNDGLPVGSP